MSTRGPLRKPEKGESTVCGWGCDAVCCYCCDAGFCFSSFVGEKVEEAHATVLDARVYLWKRFARLAPTFYATNLFAVGVWIQWMRVIVPPGMRPFWVGWGIAGSITGLSSWLACAATPLSEGWTISTMMFFYMAYPAIAPRFQRIRLSKMRHLSLLMFGLQAFAMIATFAP